MADGEDCKCPQSINYEESTDMTKVIVKLVIPGLTVEKKLFSSVGKPKPGEAEVDVKFDTMGLEMSASIIKKGKTTKYAYKVNELPGEIDTGKSKVEYKKDLVILSLVKTEESSSTWAVKMAKNGLDQKPSE